MKKNYFLKTTLLLGIILLLSFPISSYAQQWGLYTLYATKNGTKAYLVDTADSPSIYHQWTFSSSARSAYSAYLIPGDTLVRTYKPDGNTSWSGAGALTGGIQKVTWDGTVAWDYTYYSSTYTAHHDICPMPNGNVLIISYDKRSSTEATQAGSSSASEFWAEKIIEVKPTGSTTGTIVWEWYLWDHLCQDYNSSKDNYVTSIVNNPQLLDINYGGTLPDRYHMNGLDYNENLDQIAISMHYMDCIFIIDHSTTTAQTAGHAGGNSGMGGDFLYRWGNPASWDASGSTVFNTIHDAHWVSSDNPNYPDYLCGYNNNGGTGGKTAVDVFNPPYNGYNYNMTAGQMTPSSSAYQFTSVFTANNEGNSQQLPNGNMLVNNFMGNIYEVNSTGTQLWTKSFAQSTHAYRYTKCYVRGPVASANASSENIYSGDQVTLSGDAISVTETSPTYTYNWESIPSGFTSTSQNPNDNPTVSTTYLVTITNTDIGCSDTASVFVNVLGTVSPTAAFSADVTSTCTGVVSFTDESTGGVDSWSWNFGDGNTSTDQNPIHTYTTNGTYSVSLTATNTSGTDTYTETNYITVALPTAPITIDASRCDDGSVTLSATGTGTLDWYDASTGGNLVNTGVSYTTPSLTSTTTYYVEDVTGADIYYVGNTDSDANGNNYTTNTRYLIFDALVDMKIVSVEVNANSTSDREIELRNSGGTVLQSTIVNIPAGVSRITLNFDVPIGTDYQLGLSGTSNVDLWRNDANVSYPYEVAGVVSITESSSDLTHYYFYYDWEVKVGDDCISSRTPVTATIETPVAVSVSIVASNSTICAGDNVTFTATPTNEGSSPTYQWYLNGTSVGTGGLIYTNSALSDGDIVTCELTSSEVCSSNNPASSNSLLVSVTTSLTPTITITASTTTICVGDNVTFTPTVTGEGNTPSYEWFVNGSSVGTSSTYSSSSLNDGDVVTCELTSSSSCATVSQVTSSPVTMTVTSSVTPTISIVGSATTICGGDNISFTPTVTGEGSAPTYEWFVNGNSVGTSSTYSSSSLNDGDVVTCELTSSFACATASTVSSNNLTISVTSPLTVGVSIASNLGNSICDGDMVIFTATGTNEGATPVYDWHLNGSLVYTGSAYSTSSINDGDVVSCTLTSSESCVVSATANSNAITMTVEAFPIADFYYSTSGSTVTLLDNSTNATSYNWSFGDGNTSTMPNPSYTYSADGTYTITLIVTNSCGSDTSTIVIDVVTEINENHVVNNEVLVYPNPTHGEINILNSQLNKVILTNSIGEVLETNENVNFMDLSKYSIGIYYLSIIYENGTVTNHKIILLK